MLSTAVAAWGWGDANDSFHPHTDLQSMSRTPASGRQWLLASTGLEQLEPGKVTRILVKRFVHRVFVL